MFNNNSKSKVQTTKAKPTSSPAASQDTYTRIGEGVTIVGNINCEGDVRVDGNVSGNITTSSRVIIGTKGKVLGNIDCSTAEIDGKIKGQILSRNMLSVTENADVEGDVVTGRLSIVDPSNFNVSSCKMEKNLGKAPAAQPSKPAANTEKKA